MQSNFCSILGKYGSKAKLVVKKLLENDMVHFLGSDVHKQNTIYPNINLAIKKNRRNYWGRKIIGTYNNQSRTCFKKPNNRFSRTKTN